MTTRAELSALAAEYASLSDEVWLRVDRFRARTVGVPEVLFNAWRGMSEEEREALENILEITESAGR